MAWIYFQELVESDSHLNHGLEQSPIVSVNPTHKAYFCHECNQVKLTLLQSGMMSQHYEEVCCQESTSSLGASLVRIYQLQELEKVWQESEAVFSSRLSDWSKNSHPDSSFWKTCQPSELAVFQKSSMPLQKSGMIVDGLVYLPKALELITSEKDGSYLPTPTAVQYGSNKGGSAGRTGKVRMSLETMARKNLWPTPSTRDYKGGYQYGRMRNGKVSLDTLDSAVQAYRPGGLLNQDTQEEKISGQLNPQWVEWLMGYRTEYTELSASVTEWFRSKSKPRSKN